VSSRRLVPCGRRGGGQRAYGVEHWTVPSVGLRADGIVMATGWNGDGLCDVASWLDVTLVAAGWRRTLGLVGDGTVLAARRLREGACKLSQWRDVAAVAAGYLHTVGLTNGGRVFAVGDQSAGACDVSAWRDVVAVAARSYHTVGVTAAGLVVAVGNRDSGQCDVAGWREIVALAAGSTHTLGLRADGAVCRHRKQRARSVRHHRLGRDPVAEVDTARRFALLPVPGQHPHLLDMRVILGHPILPMTGQMVRAAWTATLSVVAPSVPPLRPSQIPASSPLGSRRHLYRCNPRRRCG